MSSMQTMLPQIDEQLEIINDIPIAMLDEVEREMYKQKLMIEITHFKEREQMYAEKRQELLELELTYRKNQKWQVKNRDQATDKGATTTMLLDDMGWKLKEGRRKVDLQRGAVQDLTEKTLEIQERIQQRQREVDEMKRAIETHAQRGRELQAQADHMAVSNQQLETENVDKQNDLKGAYEIKKQREQAGWEAEDKLRTLKNKVFEADQKLTDVKKEQTARMEELDYNNQEIERQEIKLDKLNTDIDQLQTEEKEIQTQLKNQSEDIENIKKDRATCQEQIRQITNVNLRLQEEVKEEKLLIERFENEVTEQRRINFGRNDDNLDLLAQADALENHIRLLYDQNKMIEDEIQKFILQDDEVAQRLENRRSVSPNPRNPSPHKLHGLRGECNSPPKYEKPFAQDSFGMRDSAGISTHHGTAYRQRTDNGSSPLRSSMGHSKGVCSKNAGAMLDSNGFDSSFGHSRRVTHTEQPYHALRDRSDSPHKDQHPTSFHHQAGKSMRSNKSNKSNERRQNVTFKSERDNKVRGNCEPCQQKMQMDFSHGQKRSNFYEQRDRTDQTHYLDYQRSEPQVARRSNKVDGNSGMTDNYRRRHSPLRGNTDLSKYR